MRKYLDLTGRKFSRLTVLCRDFDSLPRCKWMCECECGRIKSVDSYHLTRNETTSCGCYLAEASKVRATRHGLSHTRLYATWNDMFRRCYDEKDRKYRYYGGRGITVCNEWKDMLRFMRWAHENGYEESLQIDRVNPDLGYSPDNCRFVTVFVNAANRRMREDSSTGYIGVNINNCGGKRFRSRVCHNGKYIFDTVFNTATEAAEARDNFIKENNLPHRLNFLT